MREKQTLAQSEKLGTMRVRKTIKIQRRVCCETFQSK